MLRFKFIIISLLVLAGQAQAKTLQILTMENAPYSFTQDDEVKGIGVELVREAFRRMNQPVQVSIAPWARAMEQIRSGVVDGLFNVYRTPERELFAEYSEVLQDETSVLFVRKDSQIEYNGNLGALSEYIFGAIRGYSYGGTYDKAVAEGVVKNIEFVTLTEQSLRMLVMKRIDVAPSGRHVGKYYLYQLGLQDDVRKLMPALETVPTYLIFPKKNHSASIRLQFNEALQSMRDDGTYENIYQSFHSMLEENLAQ
ncbi:MAG: transporter substrate-binding domain-containing protein [Pseudomonadales bacterium]|nr:transporter substrate-binding domain-containing protein [Pseudomonadales bacterium]